MDVPAKKLSVRFSRLTRRRRRLLLSQRISLVAPCSLHASSRDCS